MKNPGPDRADILFEEREKIKAKAGLELPIKKIEGEQAKQTPPKL